MFFYDRIVFVTARIPRGTFRFPAISCSPGSLRNHTYVHVYIMLQHTDVSYIYSQWVSCYVDYCEALIIARYHFRKASCRGLRWPVRLEELRKRSLSRVSLTCVAVRVTQRCRDVAATRHLRTRCRSDTDGEMPPSHQILREMQSSHKPDTKMSATSEPREA